MATFFAPANDKNVYPEAAGAKESRAAEWATWAVVGVAILALAVAVGFNVTSATSKKQTEVATGATTPTTSPARTFGTTPTVTANAPSTGVASSGTIAQSSSDASTQTQTKSTVIKRDKNGKIIPTTTTQLTAQQAPAQQTPVQQATVLQTNGITPATTTPLNSPATTTPDTDPPVTDPPDTTPTTDVDGGGGGLVDLPPVTVPDLGN